MRRGARFAAPANAPRAPATMSRKPLSALLYRVVLAVFAAATCGAPTWRSSPATLPRDPGRELLEDGGGRLLGRPRQPPFGQEIGVALDCWRLEGGICFKQGCGGHADDVVALAAAEECHSPSQ
eukprot:808681-Pyramimonas_sp.AAC.1